MERKVVPLVSLAVFCLWMGADTALADLVAHWKLDEKPPATTDPDSILDSGPELSYHGTAEFAQATPIIFEVDGANANTATAADFTNASIDVPFDPALNPESFTFCAWALPDAAGAGSYRSLVTSRHDIGPNVDLRGYILYNDAGGIWNYWTGDGNPGWAGLAGPPVEVGVWQHLAISFDAETMTKRLFVNGVEVASATDQGYVPNQTRDLHIGGGGDMGTQYYFDGSIDDAALWDIALDEGQILDAMDMGAASVPDNMVAHWKLDEPDGTSGPGSIKDSSGGGFDGNPPRLAFEPGQPGANDKTGTSIAFSNAAIHVPYNEALNPESFTVTLWVKPDAAGGGAYRSAITSRHDIGPNVDLRGYILYNDAGGVWSFWTGDGNPGWAGLAGPRVEVGVWQHLAISFDAATMTKTIFFNGEEAASATDQGYVPNEVQNLHIGAGADMGNMFQFFGNIDDVGLYDEALTQEEIQCIMDEGVAAWEKCETPRPIITSVEPATGPIEGGTGVTIKGKNFMAGAEVRFGGVPATDVNVISPTEITCKTPAHAAGTVAVEVRNPDGGTGSLDNAFTYKIPPITFIRGDTDGNGQYILNDGIQILERLFAGRVAFASDCDETGDVDGNGSFTIGDPISLFNYLFAGGAEPAPPGATCGPAPILIGCNRSTCTPGG